MTAFGRLNQEKIYMLTDLTLRNLKPRVTLYKVTDRDGMYVAITPTGPFPFVLTIASMAGARR